MPKITDHTNLRYKRLVAIRFVEIRRNRMAYWLCRCDCGAEVIVQGGHLTSGNTGSCGCLVRDNASDLPRSPSLRHGHARTASMTPEYRSWRSMKNRCTNPRDIGYADYGGRGISVCDEWLNSFDQFLADMGLKPTRSHTINRIDNETGYERDNCLWSSKTEQSRNTRITRLLEVYGQRMTASEARERYAPGLSKNTFKARLARGFPVETALSLTPLARR